ncbi:tetraacyldisaccharide 4'-kinase [Marinobacter sp. CA1]|uniref:tetraacyldisaccharide 4'-kinase n=1 Tax=Marinobacter sp. CA1 TaxID=2817656 RepID=UPI001D062E34|nr:tetraacyldisaccharide 4'-kinase [Marinobacter sp. CA1]UDL06879.1 tetraacyldisaccharide 4'-kinase [Marinobacter sp. CA1]
MTAPVERLWYGQGRPLWPLWPLAWLYRSIARRRRLNARGEGANPSLSQPVIVVGNITAGGTGKSPLTAWLVAFLRDQGWSPVILTRGYGGRSKHHPLTVQPDSDVQLVGDEPLMLAQQCGCPVVVDPKRCRGGQWAIDQKLGDILVCDDGLQHYALPRDLELAVFDGERGMGNGAPIPVGPLREPPERLATVDAVVTNGHAPLQLDHPHQYCMTLAPTRVRHLHSGQCHDVAWLAGKRVRAVAGIGNPERFFNTLRHLGAKVRGQPFGDHHHFHAGDLAVEPGEALLMTAKDAVKCRQLAPEESWVLDVEAQLPEAFGEFLLQRLAGLQACTSGTRINPSD